MNRVVYELSKETRSRWTMVCIRVRVLPSQRKESSVIRECVVATLVSQALEP